MLAWRWMEVLVLQAVLAGTAGWLWGPWAALAGALLATWLWMLWDHWQVERLRQWLMAGELAAFPALKGVWSMVATYVRRAVRTREQAVAYLRDWAVEHERRHGYAHRAIETRDTGAFVGSAGLLWRDPLPAPHVGYAIAAAHQGAGYAADGYARLRGLGVVCTTFGVGE